MTVEAIQASTPIGLPVGTALSPSRASDFLTCPLLFRFRAIDRIPERPSSAAVRGTLLHAVLEDLFDLPAAERTIEAAKELLLPTWERMLVDNPDAAFALDPDAAFPPDPQAPREALSPAVVMEWISTAEPLLATYFDLEDPTRLEPQARELRVEIQLDDGPPLRGIIDRVDVAPGDLVRVVDYKSGRSPGVGFEQKALFQMRFYALMLWRIDGNIPTRLQLIYLGDSQVLKYDPTEAELIALRRRCAHCGAPSPASRPKVIGRQSHQSCATGVTITIGAPPRVELRPICLSTSQPGRPSSLSK